MEIQAAVLKETKAPFTIMTLTLDDPKPHEVLVKIVAAGVCHTDVVVAQGDIPLSLPIVLGHEGSGIVEKVGDQVTDFAVGDHVVLGFASCGTCKFCRTGVPGTCVHFDELNFGGELSDGSHRLHLPEEVDVNHFFGQSAFATHAVVNANNLVKVPKDLDLRFLGPLGCGLMTGAGTVLNVLQPEAGSSLIVFGSGAVGMAAIMAGKIANCRHIIAVDVHADRLLLARKLGATATILSKGDEEALLAQIMKVTDGAGADYALDTTGAPAVIQTALQALATKGKLATLAAGNEKMELDVFNALVVPGRTIVGVVEGDAIPQTFVPLLVEFYRQGQFAINELIEFYAFHSINQAFADAKSGATIKPILVMDDTYKAPPIPRKR